MPDLRPSITSALAAFGISAVVTVPGASPVPTTVIWLAPVAIQTEGVVSRTNDPLPVLSLPRSAVPTVARGTLIVAAEYAGGPAATWCVEAILGKTADEIRVVVIPQAA
jgi:hypothetical protein